MAKRAERPILESESEKGAGPLAVFLPKSRGISFAREDLKKTNMAAPMPSGGSF